MLIIAWVSAPICSLPQSYFFNVRRHPLVENYLQCTPIGSFPSKHVVIGCLFFTLFLFLYSGVFLLLLCPDHVPYPAPGGDAWELHHHHRHDIQEGTKGSFIWSNPKSRSVRQGQVPNNQGDRDVGPWVRSLLDTLLCHDFLVGQHI